MAFAFVVLAAAAKSGGPARVGISPPSASGLMAWRQRGESDRFALQDGRYRQRYNGETWSFRERGGRQRDLSPTLLSRWDP